MGEYSTESLNAFKGDTRGIDKQRKSVSEKPTSTASARSVTQTPHDKINISHVDPGEQKKKAARKMPFSGIISNWILVNKITEHAANRNHGALVAHLD